MDPITIAIIAAVSAGVAKGAGAVGEKVLVDAYEGLKSLIKRKFGDGSDVSKAIEDLEAKPASAGRKETLKEEIAASKADQDAEILKAAQALQDQLKAQPHLAQYVQQVQGSYNALAQDHSTATVTGVPPTAPKE